MTRLTSPGTSAVKILVCVKRVPMTGGRIVLTDDAQAIETRHLGFTISPHEECGVEEAVRLVEAHGGESVVLTLGPPEAEEQLRDAMAIGIDRAHPPRHDGEEWDPQATAGAIVDAIRADEAADGPFDLVFFGNEAADSGELPGRDPGRARARAPRARPGSRASPSRTATVRCEQEVAGGRDVYQLPLPAVVTVLEGLNLPRYPSVPGRLRAQRKPVDASTPAAARLAPGEAAARRPGGPGQGRPRSSATARTRRRAVVDVLQQDRRARGERSRRGRARRRRADRRLAAGADIRPRATQATGTRARRGGRRSSRAALGAHGVGTVHVAEHEAFGVVRARGDRRRASSSWPSDLGPAVDRRGQRARQRGDGPRRREARPAVRRELHRRRRRATRLASPACAGAAACSRRPTCTRR